MKSSILRQGFTILRSERAVPLDVVVGHLWPASSTFRIADHSRPTAEVTRTSRPQRGPPPKLRALGRTATTTSAPSAPLLLPSGERDAASAENRRKLHLTTSMWQYPKKTDVGCLRQVARAVAAVHLMPPPPPAGHWGSILVPRPTVRKLYRATGRGQEEVPRTALTATSRVSHTSGRSQQS